MVVRNGRGSGCGIRRREDLLRKGRVDIPSKEMQVRKLWESARRSCGGDSQIYFYGDPSPPKVQSHVTCPREIIVSVYLSSRMKGVWLFLISKSRWMDWFG